MKIIVLAKGTSERCPGKNLKLLPHTLNYISKLNLIKDAIVLTDCDKIKSYCKDQGFNNFIHEAIISKDMIPNIKVSLLGKVDSNEPLVFLAPTSPLREQWLLESCLNQWKLDSITATFTNSNLKFITHKNSKCEYCGGSIFTNAIWVTNLNYLRRFESIPDMWQQAYVTPVYHTYPMKFDIDYQEDLDFFTKGLDAIIDEWFVK